MSYESQRKWSDEYHHHVRRILAETYAQQLFETASDYKDQNEASDLVLMQSKNIDVAVRIRTPGYINFQWEFTVRTKTRYDCKTEITKIINGYADCMFYAHAKTQNPEDGFAAWMVVDLDEFRAEAERCKNPCVNGCGICFCTENQNTDSTGFAAFDVRNFSNLDNLVVASSLPDHTLSPEMAAAQRLGYGN